MILRNILNNKNINKEIKEGIVTGLVAGLVIGIFIGIFAGLSAGLSAGIRAGLVTGLVAGLVTGLVTGLVVGLVIGLVTGLVAGIVAGIVTGQFGIPIIPFIIIAIILMELLWIFFTSKTIKKKNPSLVYILGRKLEELFEVLIVMVTILNIRWVFQNVDFKKYYPTFIKWFGYLGIAALILGAIILWLYLNRLAIRRKG